MLRLNQSLTITNSMCVVKLKSNCDKVGNDTVRAVDTVTAQIALRDLSLENSCDTKPLLATVDITSAQSVNSYESLPYIDDVSGSRSHIVDNSRLDVEIGSENNRVLLQSPSHGSSIDFILDKEQNDMLVDEPLYTYNHAIFNSNDFDGKEDAESCDVTKKWDDTGNENSSPNSEETLNEEQTVAIIAGGKVIHSETPCSDMRKLSNCDIGREQSNPKPCKRYSERNSSMTSDGFVRQLSIDYFDEGDINMELCKLLSPVNDAESMNKLPESSQYNIVFSGINQSVDNLSCYPSYCYGNQTEYGTGYEYGNVGYYSPLTEIAPSRDFEIVNMSTESIDSSIQGTLVAITKDSLISLSNNDKLDANECSNRNNQSAHPCSAALNVSDDVSAEKNTCIVVKPYDQETSVIDLSICLEMQNN